MSISIHAVLKHISVRTRSGLRSSCGIFSNQSEPHSWAMVRKLFFFEWSAGFPMKIVKMSAKAFESWLGLLDVA